MTVGRAEVNKQVQTLCDPYLCICRDLCVCVLCLCLCLYLCLLNKCHHDGYNEGGREVEMNKQGRTLGDAPRKATACVKQLICHVTSYDGELLSSYPPV